MVSIFYNNGKKVVEFVVVATIKRLIEFLSHYNVLPKMEVRPFFLFPIRFIPKTKVVFSSSKGVS